MAIIETYGKGIVSVAVALVTWVLNEFFRGRAKLQVASPHEFTFLVPQPLKDENGNVVSPTQTVHTKSFIVRNAGRESVSKVELVFNWKPMCLNVWPTRHYETHDEPDGRQVLIFGSLAPRELVGIEIMGVNVGSAGLPALATVRSAHCIA